MNHPFTAIVSGSTGSGKTFMIKKLLENANELISPPPDRIIWSYGQWQPMYDEMKESVNNIEFVKDIPDYLDSDEYIDTSKNTLVIFDDLQTDATQDSRISDLYTKGSHHRNMSVITFMQNLFNKGKENRTMNLNSHYIFLFKNPRDKLQVMCLARQMYPSNTSIMMRAFNKATDKPYGYLLLDLKPNTPEDKRLVTDFMQDTDLHSNEVVEDTEHDSLFPENGDMLLNSVWWICNDQYENSDEPVGWKHVIKTISKKHMDKRTIENSKALALLSDIMYGDQEGSYTCDTCKNDSINASHIQKCNNCDWVDLYDDDTMHCMGCSSKMIEPKCLKSIGSCRNCGETTLAQKDPYKCVVLARNESVAEKSPNGSDVSVLE